MLQRREALGEDLIIYTHVDHITYDDVIKGLEKFAERKAAGNIIDCEYHDDVWNLTDQKRKYYFNFGYRKEEFRAVVKKHNIPYEKVVDHIKAFMIQLVGIRSLANLRLLLSALIDELIRSEYGFSDIKKIDIKNASIALYASVVRLLPGVSDAYVKNVLLQYSAYVASSKKMITKKQTTMADFQSYFILDHILKKEWTDMSQEDKNFYFPLYLYWRITTVIPLRVTEFCLLPYNCISTGSDNIPYLTVRRTRLKGYGDKIHTYLINDDYETNVFPITTELFDLIDQYRMLSHTFKRKYDLLFSVEFCQTYCKFKKFQESERIFLDSHLNYILQMFYEHVMPENGYTVIEHAEMNRRFFQQNNWELQRHETMRFQLKETRHLAMINLIVRGCNPLLIKDYAGHADSDISENYYGNTVQMIKCATKYYYDLAKNRKNIVPVDDFSEHPLSMLIDRSQPHVEVDNGRCYSEVFMNDDIKDCLAAGGKCVNCRYFVNDNRYSNAADIEKLESDINKEMLYVRKLISNEKIMQRLDELQKEMLSTQSDIRNLALYYYKQLEAGKETSYAE